MPKEWNIGDGLFYNPIPLFMDLHEFMFFMNEMNIHESLLYPMRMPALYQYKNQDLTGIAA